MKFLLIILIIILIVPIGSERSGGGYNVKPKTKSKKPEIDFRPSKKSTD